jgi:hypothetical protein
MVGGLKAPSDDGDPAEEFAAKGGVYFVLEDADLQIGKVGKVCYVKTHLLQLHE